MKNALFFFVLLAAIAAGQQPATAPVAPALPSVGSLSQVHRIYVEGLTGKQDGTLRDLIIASLASTGLFTVTDNPDRADAILRGAADDRTHEDVLDISEGTSARQNGGRSSSGSSYSRAGSFGGLSISDSQSHHSRELKHNAFAALRLCNRDGDVLWSTTQESSGAKFRGAGADVAEKVARQLTLDMERARRPVNTSSDTGGNAR